MIFEFRACMVCHGLLFACIVTFCNPCCNKRHYIHVDLFIIMHNMQYWKNKSINGNFVNAGFCIDICDM